MSIRLSEKHGVNPTLCKCFYCGESKGVALLGKLPDDAEAPRECVMDYEPCDECKEKFSKGVLCIETTTETPKDNRPCISKTPTELYPTGKYLVLTSEGISRMFQRPFKNGDKCFLEEGLIDMILKDVEVDE